ncbi:MAG TPA: iron uptake transporter permease EfeU [bacterium]|nr:iron uptake transporter permease EfeU [bacterium]
MSAFVITLREGLEMSLIVGIILAYLARTGHRREFGAIWAGVAGAIGVSALAGGIILVTAGEFSGRGEQLFEALAMLTAVAVLTYMIFWMRRQAATMRTDLQSRLSDALRVGSSGALVVLTVASVGREGVETALFLFATARASAALPALAGAVLGLVCAVLLGALIYRGSYRLNLRTFFNVTGLLLLLVGAGLFVRGIGELQEAGLVPPLVPHMWNTGAAVPETSTMGSLLQAVLGYISAPSLLQVVLYLSYLAIVGWRYFTPVRRSALVGSAEGATGPARPAVPPKA